MQIVHVKSAIENQRSEGLSSNSISEVRLKEDRITHETTFHRAKRSSRCMQLEDVL